MVNKEKDLFGEVVPLREELLAQPYDQKLVEVFNKKVKAIVDNKIENADEKVKKTIEDFIESGVLGEEILQFNWFQSGYIEGVLYSIYHCENISQAEEQIKHLNIGKPIWQFITEYNLLKKLDLKSITTQKVLEHYIDLSDEEIKDIKEYINSELIELPKSMLGILKPKLPEDISDVVADIAYKTIKEHIFK